MRDRLSYNPARKAAQQQAAGMRAPSLLQALLALAIVITLIAGVIWIVIELAAHAPRGPAPHEPVATAVTGSRP